MSNFAKYAYLNSYLNRFKKILPSNTLTVPELHRILHYIGFKHDYGTMYERQKLDDILNNKYIIDKIRQYLGINNSDYGYTEIKPLQKQITPNYYSDEDMKNASEELLKNDEVFFEHKIVKLTENDLKKIIKECVKKIKKRMN